MWKKVCILVFAFMLFAVPSFAATKDDVIAAINKTYVIGDETFRLPQNIISKAEKYLNAHPLTSDKYDNILGCIDRAVEIAKKNGTTNIAKIDKQDIKEGLNLMVEASKSANVDVSKVIAETNIPVQNEKNDVPSVKEDTQKVENVKIENNVKTDEIIQASDDNQEIEKNIEEVVNEDINYEPTEVLPAINDVFDFKDDVEVDRKIERNLILIALGFLFIFFLLILIFVLIFKSKWYKILKYIVMIILVILILFVLATLIVFLINFQEAKMIYKIYYLFK